MSLHAPRCSYPHPVARDRRNRTSVQLGREFERCLVAALRLVEAKPAV
jgi:hypothetical protein